MNRAISPKILAIIAVAFAVFAATYSVLSTHRWEMRVESLERSVTRVVDLGEEILDNREKIGLVIHHLSPLTPDFPTTATLALNPRD